MSKVKSRYWDFINSSDYDEYHLNHQPEVPVKLTRKPSDAFNSTGEYAGSQTARKRLAQRFKKSPNV